MVAETGLVERYLNRIGLDAAPPSTVDGVERLMRAHLTNVPFENLDVYLQRGVATDLDGTLRKIIDRRRGGWCFELNSAFAALLEALGFEVRLLGAAVLLNGPNRVVDHLTLEVVIDDRPHLVDVGFGDGFAAPLPLNTGPDSRMDGRTGTFGFLGSAEGTTLVRYTGDTEAADLEPQYRFRRVTLTRADFVPASDRLYHDPDVDFRQGPMATRLLDGGPDRVTLTTDRLRTISDGRTRDTALDPDSDAWHAALARWFDITI